jgi:hypothetical protein
MRAYGHADCGVYGEVLVGGDIAPGMKLSHQPGASSLPFNAKA